MDCIANVLPRTVAGPLRPLYDTRAADKTPPALLPSSRGVPQGADTPAPAFGVRRLIAALCDWEGPGPEKRRSIAALQKPTRSNAGEPCEDERALFPVRPFRQ